MTRPAVAVCAASVDARIAQLQGEDQQHGQRHHHVDAGDDHPVDLALQRRGGVAEGARLTGEFAGVAVLAHRVDLVAGRSRRCRRSRRGPGRPRCLRTPSASPVSIDSSRVIPREPVTSPSATSWSPGATSTTSPGTISSASRLGCGAVADHLGVGGDQHRQLVERALRLQLLADADVGVDHRDQAEDRVGVEAKADVEHEEDADDRVEEGEDVAGDDARGRTRGGPPAGGPSSRSRFAAVALERPCSIAGVRSSVSIQ